MSDSHPEPAENDDDGDPSRPAIADESARPDESGSPADDDVGAGGD